MTEGKDIEFVVNDNTKFTISNENRTLNAKEIFDALDYHCDDTYCIESKNDFNQDVEVLKEFERVMESIINELNMIETSEVQKKFTIEKIDNISNDLIAKIEEEKV